jgi:hypothetical protein
MMRSFMTMGSLTWGAELDEDPGGSDTTSFPRENTVMMVDGGCPPSRRHRVSNLIPRVLTHCGWGHRGSGVQQHMFSNELVYIYISVCVCENVYYNRSEGQKKEGMEIRQGRQPEATDMTTGPSSVPQAGAGGLFFSHALQNETSHCQDLTS